MDAAARQRRHRGPVADVAVAADQCFAADAHVGERDVGGAGPLLAHLGVLAPTLMPGASAGTRNTAIPVLVSVGRRGSGEHHEQAGFGGVGDELLAAVDDPAVAVGLRRGLEARGLDPAPGSVSANDATISPEAMPGSHCAFCSSVPNPTSTWPAMPLLVPNIERSASDV